MASSNGNDDEPSGDDKLSTTTTTTTTTTTNSFFTLVGSTTSTVVAGTFFVVLAYRHDAYMLTFWIGSILNAIASKVLKRVLNQDRPVDDDAVMEGKEKGTTTMTMTIPPKSSLPSSNNNKPNDKGMPSSHAMALGFIGMYTSVGLWEPLAQLAISTSSSGGGIGSLIVIASTVYGSIWSYVAVSLTYRVKSRLHSIEQVLVGLFFGVTNAIVWYSLALGTNPLVPSSANVMDAVSFYLLPEGSGTIVQCVVVPAVVGLLVVGSVERRIMGWWRKVKRS